MTDRYSNIFVTAPSPENLKAVHEFIFKGFEALHYQVCAVVDFASYFRLKHRSVKKKMLPELTLLTTLLMFCIEANNKAVTVLGRC